MLIIWLQGIWLPLHGYNFADTPLWAGIFLLPLTAGFLLAGPVSGYLSDRYGARPFATAGMAAVRAQFHRPAAHTHQLPLLGVRLAGAPQRDRVGDVRGAEHVRHHEQRAAQSAGPGVGNARHVPEQRAGDLDRRVLFPPDQRAARHPAPHAVQRGCGPRASRRTSPPTWPRCRPFRPCSPPSWASTRCRPCSSPPGCWPASRPRACSILTGKRVLPPPHIPAVPPRTGGGVHAPPHVMATVAAVVSVMRGSQYYHGQDAGHPPENEISNGEAGSTVSGLQPRPGAVRRAGQAATDRAD